MGYLNIVDALHSLIQNGEIRREDFIFQTKPACKATRKEFEQLFEKSWEQCEKLGYIDLLSFWLLSTEDHARWVLDDGEDMCMAAALEYKRAGAPKNTNL